MIWEFKDTIKHHDNSANALHGNIKKNWLWCWIFHYCRRALLFVCINPLSVTLLGTARHFFFFWRGGGGYFRKILYFTESFANESSYNFYGTQIGQAKGKSFQNNVAANEITKHNISAGIKPKSKLSTFS